MSTYREKLEECLAIAIAKKNSFMAENIRKAIEADKKNPRVD